jgi:hypothetical protein
MSTLELAFAFFGRGGMENTTGNRSTTANRLRITLLAGFVS